MGLLEIGYGICIGLKEPATWQACGKNGCFNLTTMDDFYRVLILLERPYFEVEPLLSGYAEKIHAEIYFPLWKVVGAGLTCQSDQWARLALNWFPCLEQVEKTRLLALLDKVAHSKWASQKSRQLADRYAKQLTIAVHRAA